MGKLVCLKQGPGVTPHHVRQMVGRRRQQSSLSAGLGDCQLQEELTSGWLTGYQENQQKGTPLTTPLIRAIVRWDLAQVHRKVRHVSRV